jgi:hypothetical protein
MTLTARSLRDGCEEGFEPSTPNLGGVEIDGFEVDQYRTYLSSKYCKSYATTLTNNAIKYRDCYSSPSKLLALSNNNRLNILKASSIIVRANTFFILTKFDLN